MKQELCGEWDLARQDEALLLKSTRSLKPALCGALADSNSVEANCDIIRQETVWSTTDVLLRSCVNSTRLQSNPMTAHWQKPHTRLCYCPVLANRLIRGWQIHRLETPQLLPSTLRENTQTYSQIEISQYALLLAVNISFVLIALLFCFANIAAILQCHVLFSKTIGCPAFLIAKEVMDGLYSCFGSSNWQ